MLKKVLVCFATCSLILAGCSATDAVKVGDVYVDPPEPLPQQKITQENVKKARDEVSYYDQNDHVRLEKPKGAEKAEKIVKKELSKFKFKVKIDPEDETYRNFVSSLLANSSHLTNAERQELLNYWKYLGEIESKQANERIKKLLEKIKSGKGTKTDLEELKGLQPIEPGVQLKDRGKPKEEAREEQKNDQSNNGRKENRSTEEEKQHNSDQEQANESEESKESDTSGNKENEQTDPKEQESADEGQSGQEKIEAPKSAEPGEQENKQSGNKQKEEFRTNDLNKPEKNGYNRYKAQQYAYEWWNKRNNEEFGYYSRSNGGCYDCWADCTSFISQVIYKGGINQRRNGEIPWFYSDNGPAHAWGVANSKYHHFKGRAKMVDNIWNLKIGDIISFDWDSNNRIDHTAVVTKKDALGVYVTQHSYDRKDAPVMHWLAPLQGVKMYAFDMGSTKND